MANKGLKAYTKQISQTIGDVAKVSVNVNKTDANMHIIIPLFQTLGPNPLDLSLIFNYQDINKSGSFGKGCEINTFKNIKPYTSVIDVVDADGSTIKYFLEDNQNYYSEESSLKVSKDSVYITGDGDYDTFSIEDQQGNYLYFDENYTVYPSYIRYINGFKTTFNGPNMDNGHGAKVTFTESSNNMYSKVTYKQDDELLYYVDFKYDSNQRIIAVEHYRNDTLIKYLSISYETDKITVKDEISKDYASYSIASNRVTTIKEYVNAQDSSLITTSISYEDRKTTITDDDGKKIYIYFDSDNLPLFVIDDDGNVVETKYDKVTKKLISQSSNIPAKNKLKTLATPHIAMFTNINGITMRSTTVNDSVLSSILNPVYYISGTGSLTFKISTKGLGGDIITALIWGKQCSNYSISSYVKVALTVDDIDSNEFKKTTLDGNFDLMTLGVSAIKSYSTITLTITLVGNASIEIGGIQVLKKDYGTSFIYDEHGNVIEEESGSGSITRTYDSKGLQTASIGKISAVYSYDYDTKGNMVSARTAYGGKLEHTYDENNNVRKTIISNFNSTKKLETINTYDKDGRFVTSVTDSLLRATNYSFYPFGSLKTIKDALSNITEYTYDAFDNIKKILFNNSISINYTYDSKNRLDTATLSNGAVYKFNYDLYNNLTSVYLNNELVVSFTYDPKTGLIKQQKYGKNGDTFDFEYYDKKQIIKNVSVNEELRYEYFYDKYDRLEEVWDETGRVIKKYDYNNDGQVISVTEDNFYIDYDYDNLGNISQKKKTINSKTIYESFDPIAKSKGFSPDNVIGYVQGNTEFSGTIFNRNSDLLNPVCGCKAMNYKTGKESNLIYVKRDGLSCVYCSLTEPMCYMPPNTSTSKDNEGAIGFWFYPTGLPSTIYDKKYLFSIKDRTSYREIGVYLNKSAHLVLEVWNTNNQSEIRELDSPVTLNKWNFFGLSYTYRNDGVGYTLVLNYELYHNGNCQKGSIMNMQCFPGKAPYHIGYSYGVSGGYYELNCYITALMIGNWNAITQEKMYEYYSVTKDYIMGAANLKEDSVDFGAASIHNLSEDKLNQFDIFPLHSHAKSLAGTPPSIYDVRRVSHEDRDRTYQFNTHSKRYAYVADEVGRLEYSLKGFSSGTVLMRAFISVDANNSQNFFQLMDDNGQKLSFFRASNKYLYVGINGTNYMTDLYFDTKKWYTVGVSFTEGVATGSVDSGRCINARVYLNGKTCSTQLAISSTFTPSKLSIGKRFDTSNSSSAIHKNCYPLFGHIEMLATRPAFCEVSTLDALSKELMETTKVSEYDELGMLQKRIVNHQDTDVLVNTYSYQMRSATEAYISQQVKTETIKYGSSTINRSYKYDVLGRVTTITDSIFGSHNYSYNARGFLEQEDTTKYEYDSNGNITKAGSITFTYDSVIKDKLKTVNGKAITYDENNPFNPKSYNGNTYTFEGRRLVKYNNYKYAYDDQGLRTSKVIDSTITNYYYEGDLLITEDKPGCRLDFLYDENNQLYGFIYNNQDKYFYVKDIMSNILGIVDNQGNLVVQYKYTAYGIISSIIGNKASTIGAYNPFRWKGYYYDTETGLYLVTTRYYNPEWCRFISPDSIEYLEPNSINGMNLYAYCYNNPVNYVDPDGHMPKWLQGLAIGLAVVGTILVVGAITALTMGVGTTIMATTMAGAVIHGAAIGTLIGAGIGVVAGGIIGGATTNWSSEGILVGLGIGFGGGAIIGAIAGGSVGAFQYTSAVSQWGSAGGRTAQENMIHHFNKHVIGDGHNYLGKNVIQYTKNASNFFKSNSSLMKLTSSGNYVIRASFAGHSAGGFFDLAGIIFSFF